VQGQELLMSLMSEELLVGQELLVSQVPLIGDLWRSGLCLRDRVDAGHVALVGDPLRCAALGSHVEAAGLLVATLPVLATGRPLHMLIGALGGLLSFSHSRSPEHAPRFIA